MSRKQKLTSILDRDYRHSELDKITQHKTGVMRELFLSVGAIYTLAVTARSDKVGKASEIFVRASEKTIFFSRFEVYFTLRTSI